MNEVQEAWRLWHQIQNFSDALWTRYENEFLGFSIEECDGGDSVRPAPIDTDLPF